MITGSRHYGHFRAASADVTSRAKYRSESPLFAERDHGFLHGGLRDCVLRRQGDRARKPLAWLPLASVQPTTQISGDLGPYGHRTVKIHALSVRETAAASYRDTA